ncbi:uncharacterized protein LY89DRAFT_728060 [Mollisia scopiformis]|uniref:Uncharacterized protein n=1 Tax=Mollisia scopiformis TaxID=149040 RepID=A0A194XTC3_MOLSC|nr:uncharacterized protein LY89DRAFT_728060 [Mollisia scopiformis]KUJ23299.1 hypothetical protein LY89DRAFT_728060 [Mollisia scopiformis]
MSTHTRNSGASTMATKETSTPRREHKPKLTMARGGILRSTRAGEASRKSRLTSFQLDHLRRHRGPYRAFPKTFLVESLLGETRFDLVGMTKNQFQHWTQVLEDALNGATSYTEFDLSELENEKGNMPGIYWREPGLSMRKDAVIVAMTEEQFQHWKSLRALQHATDSTLAHREAEEQRALFV